MAEQLLFLFEFHVCETHNVVPHFSISTDFKSAHDMFHMILNQTSSKIK